MKLSPKLLVALGLIAFLAFLFISAPASLLTKTISHQTPIEINGVSGTIWHGQAKQLITQDIVIGPVEWSVQPRYLLLGKLAGSLELHRDDTSDNVSGLLWFSLGFPGIVTLRDAQLETTAEWFFARAALPVAARGRIVAHIDELKLRKNALPEVNAQISWQEAGVTFPKNYSLGRYDVVVYHQPADKPERLIADISDQKSPLHIRGQAEYNATGEYQLVMQVSADATAPADIARMLPLLGKPNSDGSVQIKRNGQLSNLL